MNGKLHTGQDEGLDCASAASAMLNWTQKCRSGHFWI